MTEPNGSKSETRVDSMADSKSELTTPLATGDTGPNSDSESAVPFGPARTNAEIGTLSKYSILKELGRGGMGAVYLAIDDKLKRKLAIKVMLPRFAAHAEAKERFLREARLTAGIHHDHIVTVYEADEWNDIPYIAMEYLKGMQLHEYLHQKKPIGIPQAMRVAREVAAGLGAAHKLGLIHRDIKPANIWLESPNGRVKILDFGLAKPASETEGLELTRDGAILGTPHFMAPEQAEGLKTDHRADLFSLGVILYRLLTGRLPFRGDSVMAVLMALGTKEPSPVHELNPQVPEPLAQLVADLLRKSPADRPQSADEVVNRLRAMDRRGGNSAVRNALSERPPDGSGTNPVYVPIPVSQQYESAFSQIEDEPPTLLAQSTAVIERKRKTRRRLAYLGAASGLILVAALAFAVPALLRMTTPKGTLAIESSDASVEIVLKKGGEVLHPRSNGREFILDAGDDYSIELAEPRGGARLVPATFTIPKNGRTTVKVQLDRPAAKPKPAPPPPEVDLSPPDRRAARWALSVGGTVRVRQSSKEIRAVGDLPADPFELTFVRLENNDKVSDAALAAFAGCTNLRDLKLEGTPVTDAGLAHFKDCKDLTVLGLAETAVGDAGLAHLKDCKSLAIVNLAGTRITDAGLKHFEGCVNLKEIWIYRTKIGDDGIKSFRNCRHLIRLDVADTKVGDVGLKEVAGLTGLRRVLLTQTNVTPEGVEMLRKALPLCRIEWNGGIVEPGKK